MQWFAIMDPGGQTWYVQAPDSNAAIARARAYFGNRGYGMTDLTSVTSAAAVSAPPAGTAQIIYSPQGNVSQTPTPTPGATTNNPLSDAGKDIIGALSGTPKLSSTSSSYLPADTNLGELGAFTRGLKNRGIDPNSYLGAQIAETQRPIFSSAFDALQALGQTPGGGGEGAYQNFVQDTPDASQAALGAWRNAIASLSQNKPSGQLAELLNPTTESGISGLVGLGTSALRGAVGPTGLNPFFSGLGQRAIKNYATNPQVAQGGWVPYLQNYLGLKQYG